MVTSTAVDVQLREFKATLVQACRILYVEEVMQGPTGHISARIPGTDKMLIKPVMIGFEEITEDEFILMDFNGNKIEGGGKVGQVPGEYHIHSELYKARPEFGSVIHTHPPYCVALSASGQTPKAYSFDGGQFADGVPLFDETTSGISSPELGRAVVKAMGPKTQVVLKNHGVAVGGGSIQETTLRNVRLEKTAWMHLLVLQCGGTPTTLQRGGLGGGDGRMESRAQPTWDYQARRANRILSGKA